VEEERELTRILLGIGRLEAKADATNDHLARINGSVGKLYGRADENKAAIEEVEKSLLRHQIDCPGLRAITEIDRKLSSGDFTGPKEVRDKLIATEKADAERRGKESANQHWFKLLQPWITWLILAVLIMIVIHYQQVASRITAVKP
jgi:hypothetical protein